MSTNTDAVPLLSREGSGGGDVGWPPWRKALDLEEAKGQILFSLPMIVTNVALYMIPLVGVMFAGHQGDLELAGSTLANSWATVTGFAFMVGLSGALETLCGQGYGAKMYRTMGIYLQSSCIITTFFSIIISILWLFTEPILILLHQEASIARTASQYMRYLIPGLFAYGYLNNLLRFLQTQSVVIPTVICSVGPLIINVGVAHVLVNWISMGLQGAAMAVSISLWIAFFMLGSYVMWAERFQDTWSGFSCESFSFVVDTMRLAIPSAAMVCLEYWAFELLVLLAGLMPDSEVTTSLISMCVNTEAIAYMTTYGLSAAASTRVSNELGAGNPGLAKHAMGVTLKLSVLLGLVVVSVLGFGHDIWAGSFSDSPRIIDKFASLTPFLVVSIILDSIQGVLSGVARGCGWQHLAMYINLATFYCIGMPIAILLGFYLKLGAQGLWLGLICGLSCQTMALLVLTFRTKWDKIVVTGNTRHDDLPTVLA